MTESSQTSEGRRKQLLEKLRIFERAAEEIHPERKEEEMPERVARFRQAAEDVRSHLFKHRASKEMMEWPELPDSDAEIAAFAQVLKREHESLLRELGDLISAAAELETTLDRVHAAAQFRDRSRALALRIARHAGGAEARLGKYS